MEKQTFFEKYRKDPWFWTFIVLAIGLFFALPLMSLDAGNSGDEDRFQVVQGNYILDYFSSGGKDTNCLTFENLKYYGSSFDFLAAAFNKVFHIDNIHLSRHVFNSFFGWVAILFVGLIAFLVAGWRAAVFSVLFLFLSPRFLGHAYNNSKDIPFAAAVIAAIFFMFLFFKQFPKVKWYTVVLLILSIAFSISIRIGGLILFGYFGFFGFLYLVSVMLENKKKQPQQQPNKKKTKIVKREKMIPLPLVGKLLLYGVGICIVGYFVGLILWPYALQSPIKHPLEAFSAMSSFEVGLKQTFEGQYISSEFLPWYYTPKFILMTVPIVVILGTMLYLFFGAFKKENLLSSAILYFVFLFPIFWIVYTKANVYGGWRHSLFAYPPMVVIAGLGFDGLIRWSKHNVAKIIFTILPFLFLVLPLRHVVANHPYEYIYFNEFTGGMKKIYGNYEMDYYYHTTREATEWVIKNAEKTGLETGDKIKVGSWHYHSVKYFLRNDTTQFQPTFVRWYERGNIDWDYAVFSITGIKPEQMKSGLFPPPNTVHTIKVDNTPVALILKRTDKSDFIGNKFLEEKQIDSAFYYFNKALEIEPYNETVLTNLVMLNLNTGQLEKAKHFIEEFYKIDNNNNLIKYYDALYYLRINNVENAEKCCKQIIHYDPTYNRAYVLLAQIYMQQHDIYKAEKVLVQMIQNNAITEEGRDLLLQIYKMQGMSENAATKKFIKHFLDKYKKEGNKKSYDHFYNIYQQLN